jgi:hypothetical protein
LRIDERRDLAWDGVFHGPVNQLVDWLAGRAFDDLSIGRPDLETLFRQYYAAEKTEA